MWISLPQSFISFKYLMNPLHSLKYSRDKKGKSELSLKATDMQEAAVKTLTCLMIWNQSEILL